jgi:hypothetical protein
MEALMAMGPGMDMDDGHGFMHHGHADPEKRAQRLRDVLQLRPDQDGALKAYLDATTPKIVIRNWKRSRRPTRRDKKTADKRSGSSTKPPTTLERLDHMTKAADAIKARRGHPRLLHGPDPQPAEDLRRAGHGRGRAAPRVAAASTRGPGRLQGRRAQGHPSARSAAPTEREGGPTR